MKSLASPMNRRGSTLAEFVVVCLMLMLVVFAAIEFDRMVLVYTTMANSARAGVRYAIVHGSDRSGTGINGQSGTGATSQVQTVVTNFASTGALNTANLNITVNYPDTSTSRTNCAGGNAPGCLVTVLVTYVYDPFTVLPLGVTLSSTSQGIITF